MKDIEEHEVTIESYDGTALKCEVHIDLVKSRVDMYIHFDGRRYPEHHFFGGDSSELLTLHEAEQYLYRVIL